MDEIDIELTEKEKKAIKSLKRLAKKWPPTLWLFAGNGGLHILKTGKKGEVVLRDNGGVDSDYHVDSIDDIYADGGDY